MSQIPDIGIIIRVFRETRVQSKVESYQRLKKMVLDATLLDTQHYKIRIKGKGVAPSPTPWCSSYRKGSLQVTLDKGRQLYLLLYMSQIDQCKNYLN